MINILHFTIMTQTHFCIHSRYSSCIKATDNEYARNGYAFLLVKVIKKGKIYGARNLTPDFNRVYFAKQVSST